MPARLRARDRVRVRGGVRRTDRSAGRARACVCAGWAKKRMSSGTRRYGARRYLVRLRVRVGVGVRVRVSYPYPYPQPQP